MSSEYIDGMGQKDPKDRSGQLLFRLALLSLFSLIFTIINIDSQIYHVWRILTSCSIGSVPFAILLTYVLMKSRAASYEKYPYYPLIILYVVILFSILMANLILFLNFFQITDSWQEEGLVISKYQKGSSSEDHRYYVDVLPLESNLLNTYLDYTYSLRIMPSAYATTIAGSTVDMIVKQGNFGFKRFKMGHQISNDGENHIADNISADREFAIATKFYYGFGVPRDFGQSVAWMQKASSAGYSEAQDQLGVMYGDGLGVHQDWVKSYMWIDLAAKQNLAQAKKDLAYAAARMKPEQIAEAKRLSDLWPSLATSP